ncbi:MAG TPA: hypothetical protein DEA73_07060 [Peptococcaceae bacterium]|nr:MAG: hypothetical protein XD51_0411 [Moorella sp. 60_41]HBT47622.1 hypothetical protein [Peptococcaceae bacterium]
MPASFKDLPADVEVLVVALKEAQREWADAQNFFSQVTEPDLVDEAIYRLQAAERKFMYLYKEVQQKWMGGD